MQTNSTSTVYYETEIILVVVNVISLTDWNLDFDDELLLLHGDASSGRIVGFVQRHLETLQIQGGHEVWLMSRRSTNHVTFNEENVVSGFLTAEDLSKCIQLETDGRNILGSIIKTNHLLKETDNTQCLSITHSNYIQIQPKLC